MKSNSKDQANDVIQEGVRTSKSTMLSSGDKLGVTKTSPKKSIYPVSQAMPDSFDGSKKTPMSFGDRIAEFYASKNNSGSPKKTVSDRSDIATVGRDIKKDTRMSYESRILALHGLKAPKSPLKEATERQRKAPKKGFAGRAAAAHAQRQQRDRDRRAQVPQICFGAEQAPNPRVLAPGRNQGQNDEARRLQLCFEERELDCV